MDPSRIAFVTTLLQNYQDVYDGGEDGDWTTSAVDLIADLFHVLHQSGGVLAPEDVARMAQAHFDAEVQE